MTLLWEKNNKQKFNSLPEFDVWRGCFVKKFKKSSVKRANYKFFASYINVNKTKKKGSF